MACRPAARHALALLLFLCNRRALANRQGVASAPNLPDGPCRYHPPAEAGEEDGYPGMADLTRADWSASDGTSADGRHVLFYAYGPFFRGSGQIAAWKYDGGLIKQWWSKKSCMGMTSDGCVSGTGNLPTAAAFVLNPSATISTGGGMKLEKTFSPGDVVSTYHGNMVLVKNESNYRLMINGCYLDHVYVCSKADWIPILADASGSMCKNQLFNFSFGEGSDCEDQSSFCAGWAAEGKCHSDRANMVALCSQSCHVCDETEGDDHFAYMVADPSLFVRETVKGSRAVSYYLPDIVRGMLAGSFLAISMSVGVVVALVLVWRYRRNR